MIDTVYNGQQNKSDCWYSTKQGLYYLIGDPEVKDSGGCYKIPNLGIRTQRFVVWSQTHGRYVHKGSSKKVIIDVNGTEDYVYNNVPVYEVINSDNRCSVKVHKSVDEESFKLDYRTGLRYFGNDLEYIQNNYDFVDGKKKYVDFPTDLYNFSDLPTRLKEDVARSSKAVKPKIPYQDEIAAVVSKYTFGVELETSFNLLPEKYLRPYGFLPVKDGSIGGNEFVSGIFNSSNDIANVYHFTEKLNDYARVNHKTSLHIHVGNIDTRIEEAGISKELFISALHWLYLNLQDEIQSMIPGYKTDFRQLASNNKDYCKRIREWGCRGKDVDFRFNKMFEWCNNFTPACNTYNVNTRVHKFHEEPKWKHPARYYHINFMNYFFGSGTIEFRAHHGTLNPEHVTKWLAYTVGIIDFAINNAEEIVHGKNKYDLSDIADLYAPEYANQLKVHCNERKTFFANLEFKQDNGTVTTFVQEGINRFDQPERMSLRSRRAGEVTPQRLREIVANGF